jgi:hypothetical protein
VRIGWSRSVGVGIGAANPGVGIGVARHRDLETLILPLTHNYNTTVDVY